MLWPGLALAELMGLMEEDWISRNHKKKFRDWYEMGLLPPKKRKKEQNTRKGKPKELEDRDETRGAMGGSNLGLLTPASTPGRGDTVDITTQALGRVPYSQCTSLLYSQTHPNPLGGHIQPLPQPSSATRTARQTKLHHLLSDLWDTYFDAKYGPADQIEVGEALSNMIEFLVDDGWELDDSRDTARRSEVGVESR